MAPGFPGTATYKHELTGESCSALQGRTRQNVRPAGIVVIKFRSAFCPCLLGAVAESLEYLHPRNVRERQDMAALSRLL